MSNYYMVCWKENIENLINDDEVFYDSSNRMAESYEVNYVIADTPEDAIRKYLLVTVRRANRKKINWLQIKKRCAARLVRRIVAGEVHLLPPQVLASGCYSTIEAIVNDCITNTPTQLKDNRRDFFNYLSNNIDINEVAAWIDTQSAYELYVEIFSKDVMAHELVVWKYE